MAGPYTPHIIVNVLRSIVHLISQKPELLSTSGVFRVAGAKAETEKLLEQLIEQQYNVDVLIQYVMNKDEINNLHLYDILGMIPAILKQSQILDSTDKLLIDFSKKLKALLESSKPVLTETNRLFHELINQLLLSHRIDHQRAGEILDHYCHLMHLAGAYQDKNLMTYNNLAIIMAPNLTHILNLAPETNFLALHGLINRLTPVLEAYISDTNWSVGFEARHAKKLDHLVKTREFIHEQLKHMKESSRDEMVIPMKSLTEKALVIQTHIEENDKQQSHSKRKLKRQLSKQKSLLEEELVGIKSKISDLTPKISQMNTAHHELQEEMDLIYHSGEEMRTCRTLREQTSNLSHFSMFHSEKNKKPSSLLTFPKDEEKENLEIQNESDHQEQEVFDYNGPK